ncbi:MAG: hypothetical protein QE263_08020 [Vampirovibrionales bacterium]|nr:hypothetical protein [Vampirovibrionales bacterium]
MNVLRFSAQKTPPPPVMGTAVDRPNLKQCPIPLNAFLWDSFSGSPDSLVLKFITHGDLVNAVCALEMTREGWNPNALTVKPFESTLDGSSKLTATRKQWNERIKNARNTKNYIGAFTASSPSYDGESYKKLQKLIDKGLRKHSSVFNIISNKIKKLTAWPCFVASDNSPDGVVYLACQKPTIAVASSAQLEQKNHQGIVNQFVDDSFSATIMKDGLDFDGDGQTDYRCQIYDPDVVGKSFSSFGSNSFAAPIAFARYACRLMEELSKAPEKAAQRLKQLNLYDFAFPDEETYQKHPSYKGAVKVVA